MASNELLEKKSIEDAFRRNREKEKRENELIRKANYNKVLLLYCLIIIMLY